MNPTIKCDATPIRALLVAFSLLDSETKNQAAKYVIGYEAIIQNETHQVKILSTLESKQLDTVIMATQPESSIFSAQMSFNPYITLATS